MTGKIAFFVTTFLVGFHVRVMNGRKILENWNFKAIEFLWSEFYENCNWDIA